ncbi:hypothetical protein J6590_101983 [Homalodisca vitripennis]|nr:hypothetical protein J6590_101983 [Homalodisca vitripennis]
MEDTKVTEDLSNTSTLDIYGPFLDDELRNYMVQETNRYAYQQISNANLARQLMGKGEGISTASPYRKKPHTILKKEGLTRKTKRRCVECYQINRAKIMSSKEADKLTKQVNANKIALESHTCV